MDTQAQMQAIVDRLAGEHGSTPLAPAALDEPWRTIYRRVAPAIDRAEAQDLIWKATSGFRNRRQLASDLAALLPDDSSFNPYPSLHEVSGRFPSVDWLWPSWIPRSMLTLLGAAPGAGKSLIALDLARRIISGEPFPDGAPVPCPGSNVIIVDAEGTPALLNQRAQAWNIDRRRLFIMLSPDSSGLVDLSDQDQLLQLGKMCVQLEPALVIVDSLAAATAGGETSLEGARSILDLLVLIARTTGPALLVIHHLRKRTGSRQHGLAPQIALDDFRGSSHLGAAARSVLALSVPAPAPTGPGAPGSAQPPASEQAPASQQAPASPPGRAGIDLPSPTPRSSSAGQASAVDLPTTHSLSTLREMRRLEVIKTNLCRCPPPLGLVFEGPSGLTPGGHDLSVPTLRYTEYVEPTLPPAQVDLCAHWLLQFLAAADEPVKPAAIVEAAREVGFPRRTLYRARQALGSSIVDIGNSPRDPRKRWALAAGLSPLSPPSAAQRDSEA